jgi:hypothetical protein
MFLHPITQNWVLAEFLKLIPKTLKIRMSRVVRLFGKGAEKYIQEEKPAACPYPLDKLGEYVGKQIKIKYLNCDIFKEETETLKFFPGRDFFYIGDEIGYHMVNWDRVDSNGRTYKVLSIKVQKEDGTWEKIYKAIDVEPQLMIKAKEVTAEAERNKKGKTGGLASGAPSLVMP